MVSDYACTLAIGMQIMLISIKAFGLAAMSWPVALSPIIVSSLILLVFILARKPTE